MIALRGVGLSCGPSRQRSAQVTAANRMGGMAFGAPDPDPSIVISRFERESLEGSPGDLGLDRSASNGESRRCRMRLSPPGSRRARTSGSQTRTSGPAPVAGWTPPGRDCGLFAARRCSPGLQPTVAFGWKAVSYGRLNTAWSPTRRHRQRRSSLTVMSSKVARPSGPAKDQVISSTPAAFRTDFTRSAAGHGVEGSAA